MGQLWYEFEKILWKNRQIENNLHETVCADYRDKPWCRCKTDQQEIADWDAYVVKHYRPPVRVASGSHWGDDEPGA